MKDRKVSVIINTYNRGLLLIKAIRSVLEQKNVEFEIIVVDDNSSENVFELLIAELPSSEFKYHRNNSNMGLSKSRQIGVHLAKYKYIAFLDDDDYWIDPNKLYKQLDVIESEHADAVCTNIIEFSDNSNCKKEIDWPENLDRHFLIGNGVIYPSTILIKKEAIVLSGGFDYKFTRGIDSDLYRRMLWLYGLKIVHFPGFTTMYRVDGNDKITDFTSIEGYKKDFFSNCRTLIKYKKIYVRNPKEFLLKINVIYKIFKQIVKVKIKNNSFKL